MIATRFGQTHYTNDRCLQLRIGDISVCVNSEVDELLDDFADLYRGEWQEHPGGDQTIRMEIRANRRSLRRRYFIRGDGATLGKDHGYDEVLPYLEWGINWRVIARRADYLQIHAASLVRSGNGVLLVGKSGQGKSTLAAGLLARGWSYLCDEFALLNPNTLQAHPFPKALCIKAGSFDVVDQLGVPLWRRGHYVKASKGHVAYIRPHDVRPRIVATPSPIRFVVFPRYSQGTKAQAYSISKGRAAFKLAGNAFNRNAFDQRVLSILGDVVRGAECLCLEGGDIHETCDLVDSLVSRG